VIISCDHSRALYESGSAGVRPSVSPFELSRCIALRPGESERNRGSCLKPYSLHSYSGRLQGPTAQFKTSIGSKSKHICSSWKLMDPSVCAVCQDPCNHSRYSLVRHSSGEVTGLLDTITHNIIITY